MYAAAAARTRIPVERGWTAGRSVSSGLIIVVNYNQEDEISRFIASLGQHNPGLDVVLVDDGSTDRSAELAGQQGLEVLRHGQNRGVGAAIRTGIQHALEGEGYEYVVIMSSNGKMHPEELPRVIAPIEQGRADYVQGSRFLTRGRSIGLSNFRRSAIPLFSLGASALLRHRLTDITCGFRAYRLSLFDHPGVDLGQGWLDRYEMEYYIHFHACRSGAAIEEVPVTIDYSHLSAGRKSKIVPLLGWWSIIRPFVYLATGVKR